MIAYPGTIAAMAAEPRDIIFGLTIGDALGTTLDGFSRGHIRSQIPAFSAYPDPLPALKGAMERWRKPGLYSSVSQFAITLALISAKPGSLATAFAEAIASSPNLPESEAGIFRHTDAAERGFIARIKGVSANAAVPAIPSARILASSSGLCCLSCRPILLMKEALSYSLLFTRDTATAAAAVTYSFLLRRLLDVETVRDTITQSAVGAAIDIRSIIATHPGEIFDAGIIPDDLDAAMRLLSHILASMQEAEGLEAMENIICELAAPHLRSRITRATVNHPMLLFPFAIAIASQSPTPYVSAARMGGAASALGAICGSLIAATDGIGFIPEPLAQGLVNRKRICDIMTYIPPRGKRRDILEDFFNAEKALTEKEEEERRAKTKHGKRKEAPESRQTQDMRLTRHVVESWTKLDKARWKKELKRKKHPDEC